MSFRFNSSTRPTAPPALGLLATPHGTVETPVFMPVGTQATVKGLTPEMVRAAGAQIILGNTYHLTLRPGDELIARARRPAHVHGLGRADPHRLRRVPGLQPRVAGRRSPTTAATFRVHIDGAPLELTPERAVEIQQNLGSDIAMVLDECPPATVGAGVMREAVRRTILWAERCKQAHTRATRRCSPSCRAGLNLDLRGECCAAAGGDGLPRLRPRRVQRRRGAGGDARGPAGAARRCCRSDKPRYLMGVGRPEDLLAGVAAGIDMFDCVMPTRNGRNALAFTADGPIRLRNARHRRDSGPVESGCACYCCANYSAGRTCTTCSRPTRCLGRRY